MAVLVGALLIETVCGFGAHKTQAHLPISPSLPPVPADTVLSGSLYKGAPTEVTYNLPVTTGGDEDASVYAALVTPEEVQPELFHEWNVNHPNEGLAYFECPAGFDFRPSTKSCIMITYAAPSESCPYGAYRDKVSKLCVHTDSVAPDRTCPSGFGYFMRGCIRRTQIDPGYNCSPGYAKVGDKCYSVASIPAVVKCPPDYTLSRSDVETTTDVLNIYGTVNSDQACSKLAYYPPLFSCDGVSYVEGGQVLAAVHQTNATEYLFGEGIETIHFSSQPECPRPLVVAEQRCPSLDFEGMMAQEAYLRIYQVHEQISMSKARRGLPSSTYLSALLANLGNMSPEKFVCLSMKEQVGTLTCPSNHSLIRLTEDVTLTNTFSDAICVEISPGLTRSLSENKKNKKSRDRSSGSGSGGGSDSREEDPSSPGEETPPTDDDGNDDRKQKKNKKNKTSLKISSSGRVMEKSYVDGTVEKRYMGPKGVKKRIYTESSSGNKSRRLTEEDDLRDEHKAMAPLLSFKDEPFCDTLEMTELRWDNGSFRCYVVHVAEPVLQCDKGHVICKELERGQPCTPICDSRGDGDPQYLAKVLCEPGDEAGVKNVLDSVSGELVASVPVCVKEYNSVAELSCPFNLGTPNDDGFCGALGVSDLIVSCPEGYTKVTSEKATKKNPEGSVGGYSQPEKSKSKRQPVASLVETGGPVCELLEYADYQVTCPAGYHRERARNTVHACVAEKTTKPSMVCPAGFLQNTDEEGHDELHLHDDRACVKLVEIAPTVVNPREVEESSLESHKHATRGEMTACLLTKSGSLSCGTERKYHAQTNLDDQERFGQRYQDKYARKTSKSK